MVNNKRRKKKMNKKKYNKTTKINEYVEKKSMWNVESSSDRTEPIWFDVFSCIF